MGKTSFHLELDGASFVVHGMCFFFNCIFLPNNFKCQFMAQQFAWCLENDD